MNKNMENLSYIKENNKIKPKLRIALNNETPNEERKKHNLHVAIGNAIFSIIILIGLCFGIRYVFFELRPVVMSSIEEITGYKVDFKTIKTDISSNIEIENLRLYSRIEGNIITIEKTKIIPQIANVFGGTAESLISSIADIEISGVNINLTEKSFSSKLFNNKQNEYIKINLSDININAIVKDCNIMFSDLTTKEHVILNDLNLNLNFSSGIKKIDLTGNLKLDVANLDIYTKGITNNIVQNTPIKIVLSDNNNTNNFKGVVIFDELTYGKGRFENIALGIDFTEETIKAYTPKPKFFSEKLYDYFTNSVIDNKITYNKQFPDTQLEYNFASSILNIDVILPDIDAPQLDLALTNFYSTIYVTDIVGVLQGLNGVSYRDIITNTYGTVNIKLDLTISDPIKYLEYSTDVIIEGFLYEGDKLSTKIYGDGQEVILTDIKYSGKNGNFDGVFKVLYDSGMDISYMNLDNFKFLGLINLDVQLRCAKSESWGEINLSVNTSEWSIPGSEKLKLFLPETNIDIKFNYEKNDYQYADLDIYVKEQALFPLNINLTVPMIADNLNIYPIEAEIKDLYLTKLSKLFPDLIKESSQLEKNVLYSKLSGYIDTNNIYESDLNLVSTIKTYSDEDKESLYFLIDTDYKNNNLQLKKFLIPQMNTSIKGNINFDKLLCSIEAEINKNKYSVFGKLNQYDDVIYSNLNIALPDNSKVIQYGSIHLNDNLTKLTSNISTYDSAGNQLSKSNFNTTINKIVNSNEENSNTLESYIVTGVFNINDLFININGQSNIMPDDKIASTYNITLPNTTSDIKINLDLNDIAQSTFSILSVIKDENLLIRIKNDFENEILKSNITYKNESDKFFISGLHKFSGIGLDGTTILYDAKNKYIAEYNGEASFSINDIQLIGDFKYSNLLFNINGLINIRENDIAFKGKIGSEIGELYLLAGYSNTKEGFNLNFIGNINDFFFIIKSKNKIRENGLIDTINEIKINQENYIYFTSELDISRNNISINKLDYYYKDLVNSKIIDEGTINASLTFSPNIYKIDLDVFTRINYYGLEGTLSILNDHKYISNLIFQSNSDKYFIDGTLDIEDTVYKGKIKLKTPKNTINGTGTINVLEQNIELDSINFIIDSQNTLSINGNIELLDDEYKPNVIVSYNHNPINFYGTISTFNTLDGIPIDINVLFSEDEIYNISGEIGYNEIFSSDIVLTKKNDDDLYIKINANTKSFDDFYLYVKTGKNNEDLGIFANITLKDNAYIYSNIDIENTNIKLKGDFKLDNNILSFKKFSVEDSNQKLLTLNGNLFFNVEQQVKKYFDDFLPSPQNGTEIFATELTLNDANDNIISLKARLSSIGNDYYATITGKYNNILKIKIDDFYLNFTDSYSLALGNQYIIDSSFNPYLYLISSDSSGTINLGNYNIKGKIGGIKKSSTGLIPVDINITAKNINTNGAVQISDNFNITLSNDSFMLDITEREDKYIIKSDMENIFFTTIYENLELHAVISNTSFLASFSNNKFNIDSIETSPYIDGIIHEYNSLDNIDKETLFICNGSITYLNDKLSLNLYGNYDEEPISIYGDILGEISSEINLHTDKLKTTIGNDTIITSGSLGIGKDNININTNILINDLYTTVKGELVLEQEAVYTPRLNIVIADVNLLLRGRLGLATNNINANVELKINDIEPFKIKGSFAFDDRIYLKDVIVSSSFLNLLLNGNIQLYNDEIKASLISLSDNIQIISTSSLKIKDNNYALKMQLGITELINNISSLYDIDAFINASQTNKIGLDFNINQDSNSILKMSGDIHIKNNGNKFSTDNLSFVINNDLPVSINGYLQTTKDIKLNSKLDLLINKQKISIETQSKDFKDFEIYTIYYTEQSNIPINLKLSLLDNNEIYSSTRIKLDEDNIISGSGYLLLNNGKLNFSGFNLNYNELKDIINFDGTVQIKDSNLISNLSIRDKSYNTYIVEGLVNLASLNPISGSLSVFYNRKVKYEISEFTLKIDGDGNTTKILGDIQSTLKIINRTSANYIIDINKTTIEVNIENNPDTYSTTPNIYGKVLFEGMNFDNPIFINDELSIKPYSSEILVSIHNDDKDYYFDFNLSSLVMEILYKDYQKDIKGKLNLENTQIKSSYDNDNGFQINGIYTTIDGEAFIYNTNNKIIDTLSLRKSKLNFTDNKYKFDLAIESKNENFNLKGKLDYDLESSVLITDYISFSGNKLYFYLEGVNHFNENSIGFANNLILDNTKIGIDGLMYIDMSNDKIQIETDNLNIKVEDTKISIDGEFEFYDNLVSNAVDITIEDTKFNFKGIFNLNKNLYINQDITGFGETINIKGNIIFENNDLIKPELDIVSEEVQFKTMGSFAIKDNYINFYDFGISSMDYEYTVEKGFIITTSGYLNLLEDELVKVDLKINNGLSIYDISGLINNELNNKKVIADISITSKTNVETQIYTSIDYNQDILIDLNLDLAESIVLSNGKITKENAEIKLRLIDKITEAEIFKSRLFVDIKNEFNSKLIVEAEDFIYDTNIFFLPLTTINELPQNFYDEDYIIYTSGKLILKNQDDNLELKLKSAHKFNDYDYLLDNKILLILPDFSAIESKFSFKLIEPWLVLTGDMNYYTSENKDAYNKASLTFSYNTELAVSDTGIYGLLELNIFGINTYYVGIVNLNKSDIINLDGSVKIFNTTYLINGDINLEEETGYIYPDLHIYSEDTDLNVKGKYYFDLYSHNLEVAGYHNKTPYTMNFYLKEEKEDIYSRNANVKLRLKPEIEIYTWGEPLFILKSELVVTNEMTIYDATINDTFNLLLRYTTPEDFLLDISHEPIAIKDLTGNSFNFVTNDFNISSVDGDIRSRISMQLNNFIDDTGKNKNLIINFAAGHHLHNTSLTKIAEIIAKGTEKDIGSLFEGFEIQNLELNLKNISLYKASGTAKYKTLKNQLLIDLNDIDNNIIIKAGYDYNISNLFLNIDINGYDLIKILDNLYYITNENNNSKGGNVNSNKNDDSNKLFSKINIIGNLSNFEIYDSFFRINKLITLYNSPELGSQTSIISIKVDDIIKNKSTNNSIHIPKVEIEFSDPFIYYRLSKPRLSLYDLEYRPDVQDMNIINYFSQILNGQFSLKKLEYINNSDNIMIENAQFYFSDNLINIINNLLTFGNIKDFYGFKGKMEKLKLHLSDTNIELVDTELAYYSDIFKIKSRININSILGLPINGQIDVSGLTIDNYGQIQLSINNTYMNKFKVPEINSLLYIEKNKVTITSADNYINGNLKVNDNNEIDVYFNYSNRKGNYINLQGNVDGFNPIDDFNSIYDVNIDLELISTLIDIELFSYIIPEIEKISGVVDINIAMDGKLFNPSIKGKINLSEASLKIVDYDEPIYDIYTTLIFNNPKNKQNFNMAKIENFSINHYNSEIYGNGELYYTGFFNLEGLELDVTSGPMTDKNNSPLNIFYKDDLFSYDGNLSVDRLKLVTDFINISLSGMITPHSTHVIVNPLALFVKTTNIASGEEDSIISNINFDNFVIKTGNNVKLEIIGEIISQLGLFGTLGFGEIVLIEHNNNHDKYENQIILNGDIRDLSKFKIRGSLSSKIGQINYLNNVFNIERAKISFVSPEELLSNNNIDLSDTDEETDVLNNDEFNFNIKNQSTTAILSIKARTYKRYIDNSPIKITLDYEGAIEKFVDNLFDSLKGEYYGTNRIGSLSTDELTVLLGISSKEYEKYKELSHNDVGNTNDYNSFENQSFQELALDSVDNLIFQRLINSMLNSLGFSSSPITISIYSSGFKNVFNYLITNDPIIFQDPLNAFVTAFSRKLEILFGASFPSLYLFGVPIYENLYIQGGFEFINFIDTSEEPVDGITKPSDERVNELYLKLKTDIDIASGEQWLISTQFEFAYEPFYKIFNLGLGFQYIYKVANTLYVNFNIQPILTYDPDELWLWNIEAGLQILLNF